MALAELPNYPADVSLIPNTGLQFLDFGFGLTLTDGRKTPKAPPDWGFFDPPGGPRQAALPIPVMLRRGEDVLTPGRESYTIDHKTLLEFIGRTWLPLPLFREEPGGRFFQGPLNWVRLYVVPLAERDAAGHDHRLILAVDTNLMADLIDAPYLGPSPDDARTGRRFSLPHRSEFYNFYLHQPWLRDWLDESFKDMAQAAEQRRRGRRAVILNEDEIAALKEGPNEPLARYIALLDLLHHLDFLPRLTLTDTLSNRRPVHVNVDLVLDLGNSRSCGLMVEDEPDGLGAEITRAFKLTLRDLTRPEQVYSEPFDSRFEFSLASFGREKHSQRSGRADAFTWPCIVRVGPEAARLAGARRGSEGRTGLSSPKRYLWDEEQAQQSWRFNGSGLDGEFEGIAAQGLFASLVNDQGKALHLTLKGEEDDLPSFLARYSCSHLMSFALAEILLQAIIQMNAPAQRLTRRNADLPRRLRRVILTMPTALSLTERQILKDRAQAALELVYLCLGRAGTDSDGGLVPSEADPLPEIILKWDEASATQVVYLYSQIALAYSGDARAFFRLLRPNDAAGDTLVLATLDIGGGTTDLVITRLTVEGQGANVTIFPDQLFRESFLLAGDDIVNRVVRDVLLGALSRALTPQIGRERAEALIGELFGGNRSDMTAEQQLRRQQFATEIAAPLAITLLGLAENFDPLRAAPVEDRPLGQCLPVDHQPPPALLAGLSQTLAEFGCPNFDLMQLPITIDQAALDRSIAAMMGVVLRPLTEIAWRFNVDLVLLSGRPSRLPAIRNLVLESGAIPASRVIAMSDFRVGQWYPFRNREARIADPKTTAAVGGMICLLAEGGHLSNFNFRSERLRARSVGRYLGKIATNNRLPRQDVYYPELDLESPDYALPEQSFEFRGVLELGMRQFPQDWWPATQLYVVDYADKEARDKYSSRTPLTVQLRRVRVKRRPRRGDEDGLAAAPDRLEIAAIQDAEQRILPPTALRLRLQTLRNREGYWLDTGILIDR